MQIDANLAKVIETRLDWIAASWIGLCLLIGGTSQGAALANLALQGAALTLIGYCLWIPSAKPIGTSERKLLILFAAAISWIGLTLIPLPPSIWQKLPGREEVANGYRLLDMELPWLSIALSPDRALRSGAALLIPLASYFLFRRLGDEGVRLVTGTIIALVAVTVGLGLAQMATGTESALRFFSPTNKDSPVGFFANTNHYAVFLVAALPLAGAWFFSSVSRRSQLSRRRWMLLGLFGLILSGLAIGRSLAGFGLVIPAAVGTAYLTAGDQASGKARRGMLIGALLGALAAAAALASIGSGAISAKFEDAPSSRRHMTPVTISAGNDMAPTGSGLGSFAPVYAMYQPDRLTSATWVNHAHNDYAEIYLELGLPGLLLVASFLLWFGVNAIRIWRLPHGEKHMFAKAAALSMALLLLHSLVDYPLRTSALAAFAAVMLAFMNRSTDRAEAKA